jgi:glycosyltransferase involved in cell wall biosynthesis
MHVLAGLNKRLSALCNGCKKRVAEMGLENRIFLIGRQANVGFYLHKAELVLHLARMEGLPNVLIEAHLAGVPVLATPAGGTDEVVADGKTGIILPDAENPQVRDVFEALEGLLSDPRTLNIMGQVAKSQTSARFLIDHVVDQTARLFANPSKEQPCVQHS